VSEESARAHARQPPPAAAAGGKRLCHTHAQQRRTYTPLQGGSLSLALAASRGLARQAWQARRLISVMESAKHVSGLFGRYIAYIL